jgi:TRAP-type C4-dicarboxylate transport system permease small subunit
MLDAVRKISGVLLGTAVGAMAVVVMVQVVTRYILKIPLFWTEELARYLMIWAGVIGAALGIGLGVHTSVQWFVSFLPPRAQIAAQLAVDSLVLLFVAMTFAGSVSLMSFLKFQISPAMQISMVIPYLAFPVGCVVMGFTVVPNLIAGIKKLMPKQE